LKVAVDTQKLKPWTRREFLDRLATVSAVGALSLYPEIAVAEPPPETTSISIVHDPSIPVLCYGPQYVATEMLKLEGFTEINYVPYAEEDGAMDSPVLAAGRADISSAWVADIILTANLGDSIVALSGMHIGCTEIVAQESIRSIRDLKGKKFALLTPGGAEQAWLSILFSFIGLDPLRDIEWVVVPYEKWGEQFQSGEIDALLLWPPDAQIYRNENIGHVILNTGTDRPWKDYFCCIIAGNRDFVAKNPVATKRALRAMLKATDMCALEPELAAQIVVENGFPAEYDTALQVFSEIPYALWREIDPEDTFRFHALRMHKLGLISQSPDALISRITDWRFLNELKQELKA
jgi:NitT/TauT family transport system substrate-binding protein